MNKSIATFFNSNNSSQQLKYLEDSISYKCESIILDFILLNQSNVLQINLDPKQILHVIQK